MAELAGTKQKVHPKKGQGLTYRKSQITRNS